MKNESRFVSNEFTRLLKPLLQYPKVIIREESKIHSQEEKREQKLNIIVKRSVGNEYKYF